jgi:hypothetical protein
MIKKNTGGIVNQYENSKFLESKNEEDIPTRVEKLIDFIRMPEGNGIIKSDINLFGSYYLRAQPFFGDFDTRNNVYINKNKNDSIKVAMKSFQNITKKLEKKKGWFFTDAKAGMYDDGEAIHWTAEEIINGKRNGKIPDYNGHIGEKNLIDAVSEKSLLKIDMIAPYYDRYIEVTAVYLLHYNSSKDSNGIPLNYDEDWLLPQRILEGLINDTAKQLKKGKMFKVIKRLFSMLRIIRYQKYIDILKPILGSSLSNLSSIVGDLNTIDLLLELNKDINVKFTVAEVEKMKDRISNIIDLNLNHHNIDIMLNAITNALKNENNENTRYLINQLTESLQRQINTQIIIYFNSINYPFNDFYRDIIYNMQNNHTA